MSLVSARKRHAVALFAGLPRHYDRMGAVLSFGQDPRWRRELVAAVGPQRGQRVLDVATGTGLVAFALACRGCHVVGLDQSEEMLAGARERLSAEPELDGRVELVRGEAERLPFPDEEFDALTFTYLLRYVDDRTATILYPTVGATAREARIEVRDPLREERKVELLRETQFACGPTATDQMPCQTAANLH